MKTYEMVALADKNSKVYRSCDIMYQRGKGFYDSDGDIWSADSFSEYEENGYRELDAFMHIDDWEEVIKRKMTQKDIEAVLGYEVELIE
jgi:hypothetical protein